MKSIHDQAPQAPCTFSAHRNGFFLVIQQYRPYAYLLIKQHERLVSDKIRLYGLSTVVVKRKFERRKEKGLIGPSPLLYALNLFIKSLTVNLLGNTTPI